MLRYDENERISTEDIVHDQLFYDEDLFLEL